MEVDVLALVAFTGAAAFQARSQKSPQAHRLTGMVVAIGIGIGFQQPAPVASFAGRVGVFLPAFENTGDGLNGGLTGLGIAHS